MQQSSVISITRPLMMHNDSSRYGVAQPSLGPKSFRDKLFRAKFTVSRKIKNYVDIIAILDTCLARFQTIVFTLRLRQQRQTGSTKPCTLSTTSCAEWAFTKLYHYKCCFSPSRQAQFRRGPSSAQPSLASVFRGTGEMGCSPRPRSNPGISCTVARFTVHSPCLGYICTTLI